MFFLNYLQESGLTKGTNKRFGAQGHVRKSGNHEHEGFEGFPIMKSKYYKFNSRQNNTTELLNISLMNQLCDGDGDGRCVLPR